MLSLEDWDDGIFNEWSDPRHQGWLNDLLNLVEVFLRDTFEFAFIDETAELAQRVDLVPLPQLQEVALELILMDMRLGVTC
jgi:hypothetical protein